jgi:hypothetical protein
MFAKKMGLNDSIAKVKADSLKVQALADQKKIQEDPESTSLQKFLSYIMSGLILLLGFLSKAFKNKQFDMIMLKRFFGETPAFWKKVAWASVITLFLALGCIFVDSTCYKFLSVTGATIIYYLIAICFALFVAARFTLKAPETKPVEPSNN